MGILLQPCPCIHNDGLPVFGKSRAVFLYLLFYSLSSPHSYCMDCSEQKKKEVWQKDIMKSPTPPSRKFVHHKFQSIFKCTLICRFKYYFHENKLTLWLPHGSCSSPRWYNLPSGHQQNPLLGIFGMVHVLGSKILFWKIETYHYMQKKEVHALMGLFYLFSGI